MIEESIKYTKNIIFVGLLEVDEEKTNPVSYSEKLSYLNKDISEYNKIIKDMCQKSNFLFIDLSNLLDYSDLVDGLHPGSGGHKKIYKKAKDEILKILNCKI